LNEGPKGGVRESLWGGGIMSVKLGWGGELNNVTWGALGVGVGVLGCG